MSRTVKLALVGVALSGLWVGRAVAGYECGSLFVGGWHVCYKDSMLPIWREVAAVPVEMLLKTRLGKHEAFPALRCRGPQWWRPWGGPRLSLQITSGNTRLPDEDFTPWVSFADHSGQFSEAKGDRASGRIDGRTHIAVIAGDDAREITRAAPGLIQTMRWQYGQDDDHRYSIGAITLSGPASEVLAACPN